jgi:peroxiredoxin (alkyl hydroperoxide reductase subunit C)
MAPEFQAKAIVQDKIVSDFSLSDWLGKYIIFFFYPLDFTFVCPTELHAFQDSIEAFEERNAVVIGCSVDSCFSHLAWRNVPKLEGGIEGVNYPIVSDIHKQIAKSYGVLHEEEGIAFRGLFLIDRNGIVRHQVVNDLPLGRSIAEVLRMLDALIFHEKYGEVCPANWSEGRRAMRPDQEGLFAYFQQSGGYPERNQ